MKDSFSPIWPPSNYAPENYKLEPEIKEIKEEILRKMHQIKYVKIGEKEKLCKIRLDKKPENPNK